MEDLKEIYIIISQTATRFGYVLRKVGRVKYNHAAIALDAELKEWYSFARKQHKTALIGGMVKESVERYTLRKRSHVEVTIFRIPVTNAQYLQLQRRINSIRQDDEYKYNLFSVLTYPVTKGFSVYKAYSCIEFVMSMLEGVGYELQKPAPQYTPDDLLQIFEKYIWFQGNLLEYKPLYGRDDAYFEAMEWKQYIQSGAELGEVIKRSLSTLFEAHGMRKLVG